MKEIQLNRVYKTKNYMKYKTLIDDEMFEYINSFNWYITSDGYAQKKNKNKTNTKLHQLVLDCVIPKNYQIDHIDGDKLNNQKSNLRIVSYQQNQFNRKPTKKGCSSNYKGVSFHKKSGKWAAKTVLDGKHIHLGLFTIEIEAAKVYNEYAKKYHGEYARLNVITNEI